MTQTATQNEKGRNPGKSATPTTQANVNTQIVARRADGELVVDSLTIAREFERNHKDVLRALDSLIADGTLNGRNFAPVGYADAKGEQRRMIELTEAGALIAMPFIGGRRAREGQVRLVNAFMALREQAAAPLDLANPDTLRTLLQSLAGQSLAQARQIATLEPKAQAFERLGAADGSLCISDAAKSLNMQPKALFMWLSQHDWIYRRGGTWISYQTALDRGLMEHRVTTIHREGSAEKATTQARVTAKGLALLATKLAEAA
ncbi:phage regulatory protein/antirepressor Ant [Paraburkholderia tropica]|uniref:phage regulatory protein/antirepressor Ant n=1 Tax=Paraburkholderia tropica TaxID=92647 RepID=UPI003015DE99